MKKMLITGGTVFVSRYIAEYYVKKGYEAYVLNRNTKEQAKGVKLIQADRHHIGKTLYPLHFDVVIDTAYTSDDVCALLDAIYHYDDYILISSSAVYPEYSLQPFHENTPVAENKIWGQYGINKIKAEKALLDRNPNAYILRPPYLYGEMNNIYREAFVFDCAIANRKFYLPNDGSMKLQFFYIRDLCRFIDTLLRLKPQQHLFNVGNKDAISIREWVELCYYVVGNSVEFVNVYQDIDQRKYFSFYNYEYYLDVSEQYKVMQEVTPLTEGLKESYEWYKHNIDKVNKKPYFDYIDHKIA